MLLPDEIQREIEQIPELLSATDFAEELGWDRRKLHLYWQRGIVPDPAVVVTSGKLWTRKQVEWFKEEWKKREEKKKR